MSEEQRFMTPGDVSEEFEEVSEGEQPDTSSEAAPAPACHWQNVPYAPPFSIPQGATYPQLYQVPWNYFQGFPYRPGETDETDAGGVETRQYFPVYPYGHPYHHPHYHYPYYGHPYYGHPPYMRPHPYYHYYYHDHHYPYRPPYYHPYRADGSDEPVPPGGEGPAVAIREDTRQLFPFFGVSPFGPSFGLGFGFPFYPRPFFPGMFYPRPVWW